MPINLPSISWTAQYNPAPTAQKRVAEESTWRWALRSDLGMTQHLINGGEPDAVYGIQVTTVVDRLFCWLDELGIPCRLASPRGMNVKRQIISFETWVLLYFLRCLARCPSQNSLPSTLFSDTGLMKRQGFDPQQIEYGVTNRSAARRQGPRHTLPLHPEALSNNIVKLKLHDVRAMFHMSGVPVSAMGLAPEGTRPIAGRRRWASAPPSSTSAPSSGSS